MDEHLELIEPDASWREAYLAMMDDYLAAGEERYRERRDLATADFPALIRRWRDMALAVNLGPEQIQQETWWLVRGGREILGTVYLRPQADAERQRKTGHVGYYIRPSERGRGYGTVALRLAVERLRAAGVTGVMVVCGKDNAASRRVVEKNGGVVAFERYSPTLQTWLYGYWISLGEGPGGIGAETIEPVIRRMFEAAALRVLDLWASPLAVAGFESHVFDVRANVAGEGGSQAVRAVLKRYRDEVEVGRVGMDAEVLGRLAEAGASVPRVLGVLPQERALLLEHAGEVTLADLLKRGQVPQEVWRSTMREVARLHRALGEGALAWQEWPVWSFTRQQRLDWALAGLQEWARWGEAGITAPGADRAGPLLEALAKRLSDRDGSQTVIWGDCNPKNVVVGDGRVRLIDFQPKESSIMLDLVLLMAFADVPETYVPRSKAHGLLEAYWAATQEQVEQARTVPEFLAWYDDELLWRILVYGGNLLRKRQARLACWAEVCGGMAADLRVLLDEQASKE